MRICRLFMIPIQSIFSLFLRENNNGCKISEKHKRKSWDSAVCNGFQLHVESDYASGNSRNSF